MPNVDTERLASSLRHLGERTGTDIASAVQEAVDAVVALFRVGGGGLMIADEENSLRYIAASNESSHAMEEAQSQAGEGPCVAAFVTDAVVITQNIAEDPRWPKVREPFLRHGVIAVVGVPVRLGRTPVGTLDIFRDAAYTWEEPDVTALVSYADVIGATLGTALAAQRAGELAGQLQFALDYRIVIDRAVGFLMARHRLDSVRAFDLLRRSARDRRRKVAEVAQFLLDTGALPPAR